MQEFGDAHHAGRRRLAAVPQAATPLESGAPGPETAAVVPAHRLLEAARALSEGAGALHTRLGHLEPTERRAVVELVTDQVTEIVKMWAELVLGVVDTGDRPEAVPSLARADEREPVPADFDADSHPARLRPPGQPPGPQPLFRRVPATTAVTIEGDAEGDAEGDGEHLTRDELTGVLNRQAGFAALAREVERCRRGGERLVVGYLNVDGLKAVNDARGEEAGDELLRKVTAALRATLRSYDVVTRLGGDEFVFSLPGTDAGTAELRFKEFAVILAEECPGSSASAGFAELQPGESLDDLVARAETAMLRGRRSRRRGRG